MTQARDERTHHEDLFLHLLKSATSESLALPDLSDQRWRLLHEEWLYAMALLQPLSGKCILSIGCGGAVRMPSALPGCDRDLY